MEYADVLEDMLPAQENRLDELVADLTVVMAAVGAISVTLRRLGSFKLN